MKMMNRSVIVIAGKCRLLMYPQKSSQKREILTQLSEPSLISSMVRSRVKQTDVTAMTEQRLRIYLSLVCSDFIQICGCAPSVLLPRQLFRHQNRTTFSKQLLATRSQTGNFKTPQTRYNGASYDMRKQKITVYDSDYISIL